MLQNYLILPKKNYTDEEEERTDPAEGGFWEAINPMKSSDLTTSIRKSSLIVGEPDCSRGAVT